jgi:hypothetical protein
MLTEYSRQASLGWRRSGVYLEKEMSKGKNVAQVEKIDVDEKEDDVATPVERGEDELLDTTVKQSHVSLNPSSIALSTCRGKTRCRHLCRCRMPLRGPSDAPVCVHNVISL